MGKEIIIESIYTHQAGQEAISIEQWLIKKERRRKRVAKRMAKRFPLFAIEFMQDEFNGYTQDQFEADLKGKTLPKKRKGKSQLARQGRYPLMQKALSNYHLTGNQEYLYEAQQWRKKMFLDFEVEYRLGKERRTYRFPSTTSCDWVMSLAKVKWKTWEELDTILEEKLRWIHIT